MSIGWMVYLIWPTRAENHFLQAGNFRKSSTVAQIRESGLYLPTDRLSVSPLCTLSHQCCDAPPFDD